MYGYAGKILRIDLSTRKISTLDTAHYEEWGGGHGMGSAVFWDLCKDKTVSAFSPENVVTIMISPLSGTAVPATARTEVQGLAPEGYPIEWFTRSNFGGRFASMLKYAGWDGIAIEGKADTPVWIDIRDQIIEIKDAKWLWGLDTWETQQQIWRDVSAGQSLDDFWKPGDTPEDSFFKQLVKMFTKKIGPWLSRHKIISYRMEQAIAKRYLSAETSHKRTTQKPAVLTIGPAGENICRIACLVHDAGDAAGQGGFGGVFGSKNLKAVSVIGTGSVNVADPKSLLDLRMDETQAFKTEKGGLLTSFNPSDNESIRVTACVGCNQPCRGRFSGGQGNDSVCKVSEFSALFYKKNGVESPEAERMSANLIQRYGLNVVPLKFGLNYLIKLNDMGILGKGKQIECDLPFEKLGDVEFAEAYIKAVAHRQGIGNDLAEGFPRAAEKWGRLNDDLNSGLLDFPWWGYAIHHDPRTDVAWGYSSLFSVRDSNEHSLTGVFQYPTAHLNAGVEPPMKAEELAGLFASIMFPYQGDKRLLDFSTENIYSENMVKLVLWHRYFDSFWKNSALYCDNRWPWIDPTEFSSALPDNIVKFWNAVTGKNFDFLQGLKVGQRIWTLDNAIWILQGRYRDMVQFPDYIYDVPSGSRTLPVQLMRNKPPAYPNTESTRKMGFYAPGVENGEWKYINLNGRTLEREKFEEFKTRFYDFQGWDVTSGWPKRSTLELIKMDYVADELEKHSKLGKG